MPVQMTVYLLLCAAVLLLWLALNLRLARSAYAWREHWKETTGRIVRFNRTGSGTYPLVNYFIAGNAMRAAPMRRMSGPALSHKVGDTVSILYDPDQPNRILLKEQARKRRPLGALFYVGIGVLVFIFAGHYMNLF